MIDLIYYKKVYFSDNIFVSTNEILEDFRTIGIKNRRKINENFTGEYNELKSTDLLKLLSDKIFFYQNENVKFALLDLPGKLKYKKTKYYGLLSYDPEIAILVIDQTTTQKSISDIYNFIKFLKINEQKQNLINKFQNIDFENSISLHFRIGDYKVVQHHHPILTIDYYKKALTIIKEKNKLDGVNVIYFFEKKDIDEVNNKVKQLKNYFPEANFISLNDLQDWEEMLTMSLCKHNIIANSTFSWWGAYFNENKEKIVCYPNKWINSNVIKQDLFFDSWTEIKA